MNSGSLGRRITVVCLLVGLGTICSAITPRAEACEGDGVQCTSQTAWGSWTAGATASISGTQEVQVPVVPAGGSGGPVPGSGGVTSYSEGESVAAVAAMACPAHGFRVQGKAVGCFQPAAQPTQPAAPASASAQPLTVTMREVATIMVDGSGLTRQPPGDQVLLQFDFIVYTDPSPRILTTTVAATSVEVEVTPTTYLWDWGDGGTTRTTDPGAAWPHQSVKHRYTRTATDVVTTLTTTWTARYRPSGATDWLAVAGTLTTQDTSTAYDVLRTTTYLTDDAEEAQGH